MSKVGVSIAALLALTPAIAQAEDANTEQMCITLRSMVAARASKFAGYIGDKRGKDQWNTTATMPFARECHIAKVKQGLSYRCEWFVNGDGSATLDQFTTNIDACTKVSHYTGKSTPLRQWEVGGSEITLMLTNMFNQASITVWIEEPS